jgi:hypothetical protein
MFLLYLNRIYQITYTDQIDLGPENLIHVDMCPKIDEYFVDKETNRKEKFFFILNQSDYLLLDFSVDGMKHLYI